MSTAFVWFPELAIAGFLLSALISWVVGGVVKQIAERHAWVDRPESAPHRKIHSHPVPLLGGIAIWVGVFATVWMFSGVLVQGYLLPKHLIGLSLASLVLVIGGVWDDIKNISPLKQILFPLVACGLVIAAGIGIQEVTNPLGGTISLEAVSWTIFSLNDLPYKIVLWADVFALLWLMSTTYATKFLDGLDGLVAGVTAVGAGVISFLSYRSPVLQPETALLAVILAGACLGFLIWNWHPARLFLGEGGSLVCGFLLGTLAIISGGKIATALLILGVPLLDGVWVIVKRLRSGHSPFVGDSEHIHQRLVRAGFQQSQIAWALYAVTAGFGLAGLFLQGKEKLMALGVLVLVLLVIGLIVLRRKTHAQNI